MTATGRRHWTGGRLFVRRFVAIGSGVDDPVPALQLSLRAAIAAALAVAVAKPLGLEFPLVALISAVLVSDLDPRETQRRGLPRLLGTILGATLGGAIASFLGPSPAEVGLGIFAAMFLCSLLHLQSGAKVGGYVCGLVLLNHTERPWFYAVHRMLETASGVGLAVLVSLVPKLLRSSRARPVR